MIVDAIILLISGALICAGMWLLWSATAEAWADYRRDRT